MKKLLMSVTTVVVLGVSGSAFAEGTEVPNRPKRVGIFERMDSNKDGMISKPESTSFNEARFKEMDLNNDGSISRDEMKARRAKYRTHRVVKDKPPVQ